MTNLGFGRRIRGESGPPPRQSNHRNQAESHHRFGGLTSGTGNASFRRGGGDRTRTTSCRATRLDQKSPRGAGPGRACCGRGGGGYARGRVGTGRRRSKPAAWSSVAAENGRGSPPGRGEASWGARLLALVGWGKWEAQGAGEEAGVEAGARLNRRVSPAPGKKPDVVALRQRCEMSLEPPHGAWRMG